MTPPFSNQHPRCCPAARFTRQTNSTNAADPHWRSWLLDKSNQNGNMIFSCPASIRRRRNSQRDARGQHKHNPAARVDRVVFPETWIRRRNYRTAAVDWNLALAFVPIVVTVPMQTTMISASITAYSTAVGPSSETRKFFTLVMNLFIDSLSVNTVPEFRTRNPHPMKLRRLRNRHYTATTTKHLCTPKHDRLSSDWSGKTSLSNSLDAPAIRYRNLGRKAATSNRMAKKLPKNSDFSDRDVNYVSDERSSKRTHRDPRKRGSDASRQASPMRLYAVIVTKIARPGKWINHGAR